jgi:hypothetical protein
MDRKSVEELMMKLKGSYEKFHKAMLQSVLNKTGTKLNKRHTHLAQEIKRLVAAEKPEPKEPSYDHCKKPAHKSMDEEKSEEDMKQIALYRKCKAAN